MLTPNQAWFYKYKPKTIEEFVFESDEQKKLVQYWIENQKIDGNIILYGDYGTGKTSLAELLINNIITNRADVYKMRTRSVKEFDEEILAFVISKPLSSKIKIVYIEEADKLHNQSFNALKDGLLENYLHNCIFIFCTNNIYKIPNPVKSRCTYKFSFSGKNRDGIYNRLVYILNQENVDFDSEKLYNLVINSKTNFRDLLNSLQIDYLSNQRITLEKSFSIQSTEDQVVDVCLQMFDKLTKCSPSDLRDCYIQPISSIIGQEYSQLNSLVFNNIDIDYENVCLNIFNQFSYAPCQLLIGKFLNEFEYKMFPNIHFLSLIVELINCIKELRL